MESRFEKPLFQQAHVGEISSGSVCNASSSATEQSTHESVRLVVVRLVIMETLLVLGGQYLGQVKLVESLYTNSKSQKTKASTHPCQICSFRGQMVTSGRSGILEDGRAEP